MDTVERLQEFSFQIITSAGEAKACAYEALAAAKKKDRALYDAKMEEAEKTIQAAHGYQFELLTAEANHELDDAVFSVLLVHAQDHLMTTLTSMELIKEISEIYLNGLQP